MNRFIAVLAVASVASVAFAQRYTSPPATVTTTIAGKQVKVEYYQPSMHGRKIFGELVPFDKIWATGANVTTSITTDVPLQFGSLKLAKGGYSIWSIPRKNEWTIVVNNETGSFHLSHDSSHDIGQFNVTPRTISETVEMLTINLIATGGDKGNMRIRWENTEVPIEFTVLP